MNVGRQLVDCDRCLRNSVAQLECRLRGAPGRHLGSELYIDLWARITGFLPDEYPIRDYIECL